MTKKMSTDEKEFRKRLKKEGIENTEVNSSWISSATYDPARETLSLLFRREDGTTSSYIYGAVEWQTAARLFFVESPGEVFNNTIRDQYAYVRLF